LSGQSDFVPQICNRSRMKSKRNTPISPQWLEKFTARAIQERSQPCRNGNSCPESTVFLFPVSQLSSYVPPKFRRPICHQKRHK